MQAADQLHGGLLAPGWQIGSRVASGSVEGKCPLLLGVLQHQLRLLWTHFPTTSEGPLPQPLATY